MQDLYYLIDGSGKSVFMLPYRKDFIIHCLIKLSYTQDTSSFRLLPCPLFVSGVKTTFDRQSEHCLK